MRHKICLGSMALAVLLVSTVQAADDFKSGPQKVSMKIAPFNPLHCSGPGEGTKACLV